MSLCACVRVCGRAGACAQALPSHVPPASHRLSRFRPEFRLPPLSLSGLPSLCVLGAGISREAFEGFGCTVVIAQIRKQGQLWPPGPASPTMPICSGALSWCLLSHPSAQSASADGFWVQVCGRLREVSRSLLGDSKGACAHAGGHIREEWEVGAEVRQGTSTGSTPWEPRGAF